MKPIQIVPRCGTAAIVVSALMMSSVFAAPATAVDNVAELNFHGTLKHFPCHVNNDRLIEVHFGKMGVKKITGQNYMTKIDYTISCDGDDTVDSLMLSINGAASPFDTSVLQTTVNDLGIKIYQNGQPLNINHAIAIDPLKVPELMAVPVQKPGTVLTAHEFKVTATLVANYQ